MSIKKIEMRPSDGSGQYGDILYPKTSADMVEGLSVVATSGDYNDLINKNGLLLRRVTEYVTATENNQKTFTLTFPQGIDLLNTDIELRVNSTYIEDKLYDKVGFNTIVFKESELGYDIGKELAYSFFTTANVEESFTHSIVMDNLNLSITTTEEGQKIIPIPIPNYNEERFKFFMVIGGTVFSSRRYTIVGNDVVLNSGEEGFSLGREIDFIVFFTKQIIGTLPSADGSQLVDGTVSLLKLETAVQNLLANHSQKITNLEGEVEYIKNNGVGNIFVSRRTPIPYTATVDCVSFPVPEATETNTVYLILENTTPVLGQDYTVDIVNKVVNLNFTLKQGETIYYTVEIKADAIVPMVSTSLTETVQGKVLDATLGKVLDDKATSLSTSLTNLTTNSVSLKILPSLDLNLCTESGIYLTATSGVINLPTGWAQGRHNVIIMNNGNSTYSTQFIFPYTGTNAISKFAFRMNTSNGVWTELANSNDINILTSLQNGYKFYKTPQELGGDYTTPIETLYNSMQNNSTLCCYIYNGSLEVYPNINGELVIIKNLSNRGTVKYVSQGRTYEKPMVGVWGVWREVATTSKIDISLLNGWSALGGGIRNKCAVSGNLLSVFLEISGGTGTGGTNFAQLPNNTYAPKVDTIIHGVTTDGLIAQAVLTTGGIFQIRAGQVWTGKTLIFNLSIPIV